MASHDLKRKSHRYRIGGFLPGGVDELAEVLNGARFKTVFADSGEPRCPLQYKIKIKRSPDRHMHRLSSANH